MDVFRAFRLPYPHPFEIFFDFYLVPRLENYRFLKLFSLDYAQNSPGIRTALVVECKQNLVRA